MEKGEAKRRGDICMSKNKDKVNLVLTEETECSSFAFGRTALPKGTGDEAKCQSALYVLYNLKHWIEICSVLCLSQ